MSKKFKVIVTQGDFGIYWTEEIGTYDNYDQACDIAYQYHGCVEEVEEEVMA